MHALQRKREDVVVSGTSTAEHPPTEIALSCGLGLLTCACAVACNTARAAPSVQGGQVNRVQA